MLTLGRACRLHHSPTLDKPGSAADADDDDEGCKDKAGTAARAGQYIIGVKLARPVCVGYSRVVVSRHPTPTTSDRKPLHRS